MDTLNLKNSIKNFILKVWIGFFLFLAIGNFIYSYWGEGIELQYILQSFINYFLKFFIPVSIFILILSVILLYYIPIQINFYYYFRINKIFKGITEWKKSSSNIKKKVANFMVRFFNEYFDNLILNSFEKPSQTNGKYPDDIQKMSYGEQPVFIRREHLDYKSFWRNWAFVSILLTNNIIIESFLKENKKKIRLNVDLCNQSYGIYNNYGKQFLNKTFFTNDFFKRCFDTTNDINIFLSKNEPGANICIDGAYTPFRWASGGVLPIAHWNNRDWYVLFFRDVPPVGWNIANGASGSKDEYKDLYQLIYREFSEELILLNREPQVNDPFIIKQKSFHLPGPLPEPLSTKLQNKEFFIAHANLRKNHDNLSIIEMDGPKIRNIETPFELKVKYHAPNLKDKIESVKENIIFTINPTEFGIEIIHLIGFDMEKEDYLLDGEIWEVESALIRQPVILISVEYIKKLFENNGNSLGEICKNHPHLDCKFLTSIPRGEFKLFDKDIKLRYNRLEFLEKNKNFKDSKEAIRIRRWIEEYEKYFKLVENSNENIFPENNNPLLSLCPVTWKTMELINLHEIHLKNI
jgi:hypothetical protein